MTIGPDDPAITFLIFYNHDIENDMRIFVRHACIMTRSSVRVWRIFLKVTPIHWSAEKSVEKSVVKRIEKSRENMTKMS